MPRILALSDTRPGTPIRAIVAIQIAKLKPGQCILVSEFADELQCTPTAIRRATPRDCLTTRHVAGCRMPVSVIVCPPSKKSARR